MYIIYYIINHKYPYICLLFLCFFPEFEKVIFSSDLLHIVLESLGTSRELDIVKDVKNMNASLLNVVQNVPPDNKTMYFYVKFIERNLEELLTVSDESIWQKGADFIVTGDYTTLVRSVVNK